ncbi:MAG: hypothetical protein M3O30_13440 [Planctomycetota bacterium]|nr:hypothetical protein [Planctomycetota bacterium]
MFRRFLGGLLGVIMTAMVWLPIAARGAAIPPYPPAVDTSGSQEANRKLVAAEADLSKAQLDIRSITNPLRAAFEAKPRWITATEKLKDAQSDYDAARDPILRKLHESEKYRAIGTERDRLDQHIESDRADGASEMHVVDAATQKLAMSQQLSHMESTALEADPKVDRARDAMTSAAEAVRELNQEFEANLRTDPSIKAARDALEAATAAVVAARAELNAALEKEAREDAQRRQQIAEIDRQRALAQRGTGRPPRRHR